VPCAAPGWWPIRRLAIADAVQSVQQLAAVEPDAIAVAIEPSRGVLVDSLIEHGFAV
jgi:hypothetical protein